MFQLQLDVDELQSVQRGADRDSGRRYSDYESLPGSQIHRIASSTVIVRVLSIMGASNSDDNATKTSVV